MSGEPFTIRQATEHDLDELCKLFVEANHFHHGGEPDVFIRIEDWPYAAERMLASIIGEETAIIAAECDGRVVGFVQIVIAETRDIPILVQKRFANVENLIVAESFRGQGIGTALMAAAHQWALENGIDEVELNVWEFNDEARALYESLGYDTASRKMRIHLR